MGHSYTAGMSAADEQPSAAQRAADLPTPVSPSPMLAYFDDALRDVLPDTEYAKLTTYDAQVATTTSRGDFHRCLRCAQWAVELAERPGHGVVIHLAESVRAAARRVHDAAHALRFAMIVPGAGAVTDVELSWVDAAVSAARAVAEHDGWDAVDWEALFAELVSMEPEDPGPLP